MMLDASFLLCLCVLAISSLTFTTGEVSQCVGCTYNRAGDGTRDRECVTAPFTNVLTRNLTCDFATHSCTTKVVYTSLDKIKDSTEISSLVRSCELTSALPADGCDKNNPPLCMYSCQKELCNQLDIADTGPSGQAPSLALSLALSLVCLGCGLTLR